MPRKLHARPFKMHEMFLVLFQRSDSAMHLAAFEGFTETLEILFSPELGANKFAKNEVSVMLQDSRSHNLGFTF